MRIAVVGFGTMGQLLYQRAQQAGHTICQVIDPTVSDSRVTATKVSSESLAGCEVALEFASPEGLEDRLECYQQSSVAAVIATTGWYDQLPRLQERFANSSNAIIYSGNFSLGVQLFYTLVRQAGRIFNTFSEYDVLIQEWFHNKKEDSPSGTASTLGKILMSEMDAKKRVITSRLDRKRAEDEIHISSVRGGYTAGVHSVIFDSSGDTITLNHTARNRDAYVSGALQAARWVLDKMGFFSFEALLDEILVTTRG